MTYRPFQFHTRIQGLVFLIVCLLACGPGQGSAAPRQATTVTGTVTDPSGAAVPGAVVEAVVGGGVVGSVTTGNDGRYTLTVPGGASRELRVSREGFSTEAFGIAAGGQTTRNVALRIAPVESAIVVTPSRTEQALAEVSAPVSLFTAPDIARSGSRQLGDVLGRVPGLSVEATGREGAMASLFSRGGESDYNLVLLDGVRVNDNGGQFDFSRISASEIESVEIVRGAQSALYGSNAIGAVVNVTTRHAAPDDAPVLAGTLEGGRFDTFRGDLRVTGGAAGRLDYSAGIAYRGTEGAYAELLPENDRYDQTAFDLSAGTLLGDSASLRSSFRWSNARGKAVGQIVYGQRDTGTRADSRDLSWNLAFSQDLGRGLSHSAAFDFFDAHRESGNAGGDPTFDVYAILEGEIGALFPNSPRLVTLIDEARFDAIDSGAETLPGGQFIASTPFGVGDFPFASVVRFRRPAFRYQADYLWAPGQILTGGYELERESNPDDAAFQITNHAVFFQQQLSLDDRYFVTAGGRLDENSRYGTEFSPRISAGAFLLEFRRAAISSLRVFLNAGRGLKNPTFEELLGSAFSDGNPDLKAERARTFDVGVEATFADQHFRTRVSWFDNRHRDQVAFSSSGSGSDGIPDYLNIDGSKARGWEFEAALMQPVAGITAGGWYTLLDTEVTAAASTGAQFQPGQPLLRRPRHSGLLRVSGQIRLVRLDLDARFVGARHDSSFLFMSTPLGETVDITVNPGYTLLGAGAEWQAGERTSVFVRADNLANTTYQGALGFPGTPRSLTAGMRFRVPLLP